MPRIWSKSRIRVLSSSWVIVATIFVVSSVGHFALAANPDSEAVADLKLGLEYLKKDDIPNAIKAFSRGLKENSGGASEELISGLVNAWDEAIKRDPASPDNHIGLGQACQLKGDFDQAREEYKQAIRFSPGNRNVTAEALLEKVDDAQKKYDVDRRVNNGVAMQSIKLYDLALEEYKRVLALAPNSETALFNMGTCYQAKGDFPKAIEAYKQVLAINRNHQGATIGIKTATEALQFSQSNDLGKMGNDLFKAQKYDEAIQAYLKLLKAEPNNPAVHFNLGAVYEAMKDLDAAVVEYRSAISLAPMNKEFADAHQRCTALKAQPILDEAMQFHKEKKYDQAVESYQRYLALQPKNDDAWYNLGAALYSRDDFIKAKQSYLKAYEIDPKGRVDVLFMIAIIDENYGKGSDALTNYMKYLQNAPTGIFAIPSRERITVLQRDITKTQKLKTEAELAQSNYVQKLVNSALKLTSEGKFSLAIEAYKSAIAAEPRNATIYFNLATCYQSNGDIAAAIETYKKVLQLTPNDKEAADVLSKLQGKN